MKVCDGGVSATVEVCNNLDDDCDGCIDCDPVCLGNLGKTCPIPGAGQACGSMVGECRRGMLLCTQGMIQCVGQRLPATEVCDGKDNDCNGFTDEADPGLGANCFPAGMIGCNVSAGTCVGECQFGRQTCQAMGATAALVCSNAVTPKPEACDGTDNDCDGSTDEDFDVGAACDNGVVGICRKTGKKICNARGDATTCSVAATPMTPEVCDGDDNDCDGDIDELPLPGVGDTCGSNVGECRIGHTKCVGGKIICDEVGPTPEICNGLDDDCDGSIDEELVPPGPECLPPGLPPGSKIVGECRAGIYACAKDGNGMWGWQCRGSVGPTDELCDNRDNNCDGIADNQPMCPVANNVCVDGDCVPKCKKEENKCPSDRVCMNDVCVLKACVKVACPAGTYCNIEGTCIDPCASVTCSQGAVCEQGVCKDCHSLGCPDGQICGVHECMPDPCAGVACDAGSYCRSGKCVKSCANVTCPMGEICRDGACDVDVCAKSSCPQGKFCDPTSPSGECKFDPCEVLSCLAGTVCVRSTGKCEVDPCATTQCAGADLCVVSNTGTAACEPDRTIPQPVVRRVATSGGGLTQCACRLGAPADAPGSEPGFAGLWLLAIAGVGGAVRVRRRLGTDGKKGAR
jgi:hypothetical protein